MLRAATFTPTVFGWSTDRTAHQALGSCYRCTAPLVLSSQGHLSKSYLAQRTASTMSLHCRCARHSRCSGQARRVISCSSDLTEQPPEIPASTGSILDQIALKPRRSTARAVVDRLSKPELQSELRLRGLDDGGKKNDLKARLRESLKGEEALTGQCLILCNRLNACTCIADHGTLRTSLHTFCWLTADASTTTAQVTPQSAAPDPPAGQNSTAAPFPVAKSSSSAAQQSESTPPSLGSAQTPHTSTTHVVPSRHAAPSTPQTPDLSPLPSLPVSRPITEPHSNHALTTTSPIKAPIPPSYPQQITQQEPPAQAPAQVNMSVTWLGTSSGAPSLRRNVSCMALSFGASTYLVDCGEGSSRQLLRGNIDPLSIKGIFISHLHGDHCFGLPGVIELISQRHAAAGASERGQPLQVYGPPGIQQLVKAALSVSLSAHLAAPC